MARRLRQSGPTFADAAQLYLQSRLAFSRPQTITSIKAQLKNLKPYFGELNVKDINEFAWSDFVLETRKERPQLRFFNSRKTLIGIINMSHRMGWVDMVPKIQNPDAGRETAWKVYKPREIERLLRFAGDDLYLQIIMAAELGMRRNEILTLAWKDVDLGSGFVRVLAENNKNKKSRLTPLSPNCQRLLKRRLDATHSPYVFPGPTGKPILDNKTAWQMCKRRAGIKGRFHDIRHTALTWMFERVKNPMLVCRMVDCSMETAEKRYIHLQISALRGVPNRLKLKARAGLRKKYSKRRDPRGS